MMNIKDNPARLVNTGLAGPPLTTESTVSPIPDVGIGLIFCSLLLRKIPRDLIAKYSAVLKYLFTLCLCISHMHTSIVVSSRQIIKMIVDLQVTLIS